MKFTKIAFLLVMVLANHEHTLLKTFGEEPKQFGFVSFDYKDSETFFNNRPFQKPVEKKEYVSLFDGKSAEGWQGDLRTYKIVGNGIFQNHSRGAIFTEREYGNFELVFDFMIAKGGNNGLLLRVDDLGVKNPTKAIEVQICDHNNNKEYFGQTGALYEVLRPRSNPTKIGSWNTMKVKFEGLQLTIWINNIEVVNTDVTPVNKSFYKNEKGRIGFLGWSGTTSFRNIKIKELEDSDFGIFTKPPYGCSRCAGGVCRP